MKTLLFLISFGTADSTPPVPLTRYCGTWYSTDYSPATLERIQVRQFAELGPRFRCWGRSVGRGRHQLRGMLVLDGLAGAYPDVQRIRYILADPKRLTVLEYWLFPDGPDRLRVECWRGCGGQPLQWEWASAFVRRGLRASDSGPEVLARTVAAVRSTVASEKTTGIGEKRPPDTAGPLNRQSKPNSVFSFKP